MAIYTVSSPLATISPNTVDNRHLHLPSRSRSTEQFLISSLKSSQTPAHLRSIHALILKSGNSCNDVILGQFLRCCSVSNSMEYALSVFLSLPSPTPFFYNVILQGYADNGAHEECLNFYYLMRQRAVLCDSFSFPPILRSSGSLNYVELGEEIHGLAVKLGLESFPLLRTAIMDMYFSCGLSDRAVLLFEKTIDRDVICWNATISGLSKCGELDRARRLFYQMPERNTSSWNTILDMHSKAGMLEDAKNLFEEMPSRDIISYNVMIACYCNAGDTIGARELFDEMPKRSTVSWNSMIVGYSINGLPQEALSLFREMLARHVSPNEMTVVPVLQAIAQLGSLSKGQWVEAFIKRRHLKIDSHVAAALIDMYGKCGSLVDSRRIMEEFRGRRNAVVYSAMIDVLGSHGQPEEAFQVFDSMQREGIQPNEITFLGILKACSHSGMVEAGLKYFKLMKEKFSLRHSVEHVGCLVDLLGRSGQLPEAYEVIRSSSMEGEIPAVVWYSLLSSCRIHGAVDLAEEISLRLSEIQPESAGNYVLLSEVYSGAGRWEESATVRRRMREKGIMKEPGCSAIEIAGENHEFLSHEMVRPYGLRKEMMQKR